MRRTISVFLALVCLSYASAAAPHPPAPSPIPSLRPGEGETLEALVATALERSPALAARRAALRAAREKEEPAAALPDPMVEAMVQNADFPRYTVGTEDMSMVGVEVRQGLPYPGKRRLKGEAADAAVSVQQAQFAVLRASLVEEIKAAYFRLAYLQQTLVLLENSRTILSQIIDSGMARYGAGEGSQMELLKAQLERTKMVREITMHHEEMAQMIGTSRETVTRLMAGFKKQRLIEQAGATLVIPNRMALESLIPQ